MLPLRLFNRLAPSSVLVSESVRCSVADVPKSESFDPFSKVGVTVFCFALNFGSGSGAGALVEPPAVEPIVQFPVSDSCPSSNFRLNNFPLSNCQLHTASNPSHRGTNYYRPPGRSSFPSSNSAERTGKPAGSSAVRNHRTRTDN